MSGVPADRRSHSATSLARPAGGPAAVLLSATIARRYYFEGASKSEIATELGLSRFKVARMLERARATGLVRIELHYEGEIDLDLSVALSTRYGLRRCLVIGADSEPDAASPADRDARLRASLGRAAAGLLTEIVERDDVLGLAWSRTTMAMRSALGELAPCSVVQLTGAIGREDVDESSIELVRDVARIARGPAFCFYAPMIVPDSGTARALREQSEVATAMARFTGLTKAVVAIGAWAPGQSTVADAVSEQERRRDEQLGVRAELGGIQLDADGQAVATQLSERIICIGADALRAVPERIAVAYGTRKAAAVRAAIRGGFVSTLVTHASLARELLEPA